MEDLVIKPSTSTAAIHFSQASGEMSINGNFTHCDHADYVFEQVAEWMAKYTAQPQKTTMVHLYIEYLVSAAQRHMVKFFKWLKVIEKNGGEVEVNWYQRDWENIEDEGFDELGELTGLPIHFIAIDEEEYVKHTEK